MAPSIRTGHQTAVDGSSETFHSVNPPSSITEGDTLICAWAIDEPSDTLTAGAGWAPLDANYDDLDIDGGATGEVTKKTATASEPSGYDFYSVASERAGLIVFAVADAGDIDAASTVSTGSGTTVTIPGLTTTVDDCLLISVAMTDKQAGTFGSLTGFTKLAEVSGLSAGSVAVYYKTMPTAGTQSAGSVTTTNSEEWAGLTFAIAPAGGGTIEATATDGLELGETLTRSLTISAIVTDGLDMGEAPGNIAQLLATAADGLTASEALTAIATLAATGNDGLTVGDATVRVITRPAAASDSLTLGEALTVAAILVALASDGADLSDAAAATVALGIITALAADELQLGDEGSRTVRRPATGADGLTLAEALVRTVQRTATSTDSLNLSETLAAITQVLAAVADGVTLSDITTRSIIASGIGADSLNLGDTATVAATLAALATEIINLSDEGTATVQLGPGKWIVVTFTSR